MDRTSRQRKLATQIIFSLIAMTFGGAAAAASRTSGLVDALQERLEALSQGDRASWSRLTKGDAFFVDATGTYLDRTAMDKGLVKGYSDVFANVHDLSTHVGQADVVVSYAVQEVETFPSGPIARTIHRTETWVQRDGRWQMASGQATIVPRMQWSTVALEPKLLDDYVGQYQWYPGKIDTVTREGNRLYSQWTGEDQKDELLAINDTTFFVRDDSSFVIFVRGLEGRVGHYVLRGWDGQSVSARKVN